MSSPAPRPASSCPPPPDVVITPSPNAEASTDFQWSWRIYDPRKIPCFRQSFLTGIGSGVAIGLASYMISRNPNKAANHAFYGWAIVSAAAWPICRYNYSLKRDQIKILMDTQIDAINKSNQEKIANAKQRQQQASSTNTSNKEECH
eukprot:TRINITY_DN7686_c0_g1_i2.p1 TRINITY_DN7686_c0_g1~~TRINITY_DN7686_c0_g1_i2.p1  ORF type:complete len:154 (-),score=27.99 TRINITY_DN7686_c0_g1_i2:12-452(-)